MKKTAKIDLVKLLIYILKKAWVIVLCAELGFGLLYLYTTRASDTFSNKGTMYISNGEYPTGNEETDDDHTKYVSSTDLEAGESLVNNYLTIVNSDRVLNSVVDILKWDYPEISGKFVHSTLTVEPVAKTGVLVVRSVTNDPQLTANIVNTVMDVAAEKIVEVVGGEADIIDYAVVRLYPDNKNGIKQGVLGGLAGAVVAVAALFFLFLLNNKVTDEDDLIENYTPPVLGTVRMVKNTVAENAKSLISDRTLSEVPGDYAQLQVRLLHLLEEKGGNSVVITGAAPEEGKSEFAASLAASCALSGVRVLLADCDFRENKQVKLFGSDEPAGGLSDILETGDISQGSVIKDVVDGMDLIPAGRIQGISAGLLRSAGMQHFLEKASAEYDLVLLDMPAVNEAADSLVVSKYVTGALLVTSKGISDQRQIRKALISAEMAGMDVLGFALLRD